jgi:predicted NUDIX family NTP pyrophosphohydrolase
VTNARSAGLLMFRRPGGRLELLLAHPGGPYWRRRDLGAWTLPKGGVEPGEDPLAAACREFVEETGFPVQPPFIPLGELRQKGGKHVVAWAFESDADPAGLKSNLFEMEWPPRSGAMQSFAEVDAVAWFDPDEARRRILPAQTPFIETLAAALGSR